MELLELLIDARNTAAEGDERFAALARVLSEHGETDLAGLINSATEQAEALFSLGDDATDDDMETVVALSEIVTAARTRSEEVAGIRAARNARMAEALAKAKAAKEGKGGEDGEEDGDGEDGEEEDDGKGAKKRMGKSSHALERQTSNTTAVSRRAPLAAMQSYSPQRARPNSGFWTIESSTGIDLGDMAGLAGAVHRRITGLERAGVGRTVEAGIAMIRRTLPEEYYASSAGEEETVTLAQLDSIRDERATALVASGGFCAPSEIIYDLCPTASMEGLLDHPTVIVRRGGLRWPQTPDFSTIYSNIGFNQTEAQAAAGTVKQCYDIPCPGFSEQRLNAIGVCLRSGILTAQAYPELIEYYVEQSLIAHAHQVNAFKLAQMTTLATSVHFTPTGTAPGSAAYGPGAMPSIFSALEIQVEDLRYKYRFGLDEVMECVAPAWAEPLIRSDLSKRMGVELENVTDAAIREYFTNRNMNLTLVRDWQDALTNTGSPGVGFGGTSPIMAYPGTVGFLIYHPDTFVIGQADVIDLSAIYDSTNITTNTFTRLFSEEGVLVGRRCFEPRYVQIDTCPTGLTAGFTTPTGLPAFACPAA